MRVVVRLNRVARGHLNEWRDRVAQSRAGGAAVAELLWNEVMHELARTGGFPNGAQLVREEPEMYQWRCSADTLVDYSIFDDPGSLFRQASRTILITSIRPFPLLEE